VAGIAVFGVAAVDVAETAGAAVVAAGEITGA